MPIFGLFGAGVSNTVAPDFYRRRNEVEQAATEGEWEAGRGSAVKTMRGESDFYPHRSAVEQAATKAAAGGSSTVKKMRGGRSFLFSIQYFFQNRTGWIRG
ncbi:hypothetical protein V6Z12_D11G080600 [Gossypium hirsutum]